MNKKINIRIRGLGIPIVALLILLSTSVLQANLHRVALDGSQAYTSILAAINAAAHGDTVLVYPGTYIENVNYNGKNIILASLELTTGEEAYRHTTIIDGNHNGSTVLSILPTTNAALYGFTIVNGSGNETMLTGINYSRGGGVCISEMQSFRLSNCVIRDNEALCGGGLTVYNGLLYLRNCTITDNYASHGGGIYIAYFGTVIFDQEQRSDVYSNTSASTQDILAANPQVDLSIYLGTATLNPSSDFYIYYAKTNPNDGMGNLLELDIQDGIRTEINQDFYVSPFGSDENDGLSSQSPLKSIHLAMQRVASDSLNPKTIHLASGTYSSEEGHFYPLGGKSFVTLLGDPEDVPVLENSRYSLFVALYSLASFSLGNVIIRQLGETPMDCFDISMCKELYLSNIEISDFYSPRTAGFRINSNNYHPSNCTLENIKLKNLTSPRLAGLSLGVVDCQIRGLVMDNCHNTGDEDTAPYPILRGGGNRMDLENVQITNCSMAYPEQSIISMGFYYATDPYLRITNLLLANNQTNGQSPVYIVYDQPNQGHIINSTFSRNSGAAHTAYLGGNLRIIDNIFDNDTAHEIFIPDSTPWDYISHIGIANNLITGYPGSCYIDASNQVLFEEDNFSAEPMFSAYDWSDPLSYRLGNSSPCINAGIQDTTGLLLPTTDLYGNPRIWEGRIDIGCNEYTGYISNPVECYPAASSIRISPNPFSGRAEISLELDKQADLSLEVYNLKGQLVRSISKGVCGKGRHHFWWNGDDASGKAVGSGIYFLKLHQDGRQVQTIKVSVIK
ncbi:MAG: FlgD immunoglobulin-like domain containing protein [Candidatus Cloacimonetes bacterium]|nr:FlgD immunoglobulin-like domain containing protein [Candidatus Cloacimonadota bacterium]